MNPQFFTMFNNLNDSFFRSSVTNNNYSFKSTDDGYKLSLLMPGFDRSEISIKVEKDDLIIEAKSERENFPEFLKNHVKKSYFVEDLNADTIIATLNEGVLTVEFSTEKKISARTITIN